MATKIVDYLSASQIGTFLTCPLAYKYMYVDGIKKSDASVYLLYGKALHSALAVNFGQKIESKKDLDVDSVFGEFEKEFKKGLAKGVDNPYGTSTDSMLAIAENVLGDYLKFKAPTIQPKLVEYEFKVKLKKYPVILYGFIDLITEDDQIIDFKTVGKSTKGNWTQDVVNNNLQLTTYAVAFRKTFDRQEKCLRIDLIPREVNPMFKTIETTRSQEQVVSLLELANKIEQIITLGVFFPNLTQCVGCSFRDTCKKR